MKNHLYCHTGTCETKFVLLKSPERTMKSQRWVLTLRKNWRNGLSPERAMVYVSSLQDSVVFSVDTMGSTHRSFTDVPSGHFFLVGQMLELFE